ncbi:fatty acid alpha-hydroxylase [Entomortierella chlamydospora]|uniref:Fatty acid alpha-hydroxylase n=1 Tax=Entomortierella chlamydospora TaxID=101097 RepID=A0A9P6MT28_9FUNG|nr:fatty acid alpha-hydroxylase [Entomortierella chlamydospora]
MALLYSVRQVKAHSNSASCWVTLNNKVYDVSSFVSDHPGGEELILNQAGNDITDLMKDELSHLHSEGAYEMMDEFLIGYLNTTTTTASTNKELKNRAKTPKSGADTIVATDYYDDNDGHFQPTDLATEKKKKFLDLTRPLFWQLWTSDYSKAFYLEQVHIPRHIPGSARIFGSPYLEVLTKTPWYIIPVFWLPVVVYNLTQSLNLGLGVDKVITHFLAGVVLWSLLEYMLHRLVRSVIAEPQGYAMLAGAYFGYILYDMTHYYLHHANVFKSHFREMKTYHLAHHYKNFQGGYGITSKVWDRVFNTELKL